MSYEIKLDVFEGPLDLLLYLIRKNEIDIYNIPVALITSQYLGYIDAMRSLNLDLAGEYLVMAATLALIKSRMLLPAVEDGGDDEEEDGRQAGCRALGVRRPGCRARGRKRRNLRRRRERVKSSARRAPPENMSAGTS